jgi:RNA polymerase sigma-70 factor, ECF subfamily
MGDILEARVPAEVLARDAAPTTRSELDDFQAVVAAHGKKIFRVLLGMLGDRDAAESLSQECFMKAYSHRASYRGEASIGTWLVGIAVNLARDYSRNRRVGFWKKLVSRGSDIAELQDSLPDLQASPERQLLAQEEMRALWSAAGKLPEKQRAVFLLRFVEEMSLQEISQAMKMKTGTVKSHLTRAVGQLRKSMKEYSL